MDRLTPYAWSVRGTGTVATGVSAGYQHTCAILAGTVTCWGDNVSGQLGIGNFAASDDAYYLPGTYILVGVISVSAGFAHTCAVTGAGDLYCWGDNSFGQLGR